MPGKFRGPEARITTQRAHRRAVIEQFLKTLKDSEAAPPFAQFVRTLEFTERLPTRDLVRYQQQLLIRLVRHAHDKLPFYRDRLGPLFTSTGEIELARWNAVPFLTRDDVVGHERDMRVRNLSADYGKIGENRTSGSTGVPLRFAINELVPAVSNALLLRAARRFKLDASRPLAGIKFFKPDENVACYPEGRTWSGWSLANSKAAFYELNLKTPVDQQLEWLARRKAPYLLAAPSVALGLAYSVTPEQGRALGIEVVILIAETVPDGARELIEQRFGAGVIAVYGCQEIGSIAYTCEAGRYHVAAENSLVEIVDSEGRGLGPGEVGRVMVTGFFNYAMPFIRYEVGDVAVAGREPCPCGRTLPSIERVVGRTRNAFMFRDGTRFWPRASTIRPMHAFVPFRRYQLVQIDYETIEFRYEADDSGREPDLPALSACFRETIHPSVNVRLTKVDRLSVGSGGKLEEFISNLPAANAPPRS